VIIELFVTVCTATAGCRDLQVREWPAETMPPHQCMIFANMEIGQWANNHRLHETVTFGGYGCRVRKEGV
jgi:hypothetical protein